MIEFIWFFLGLLIGGGTMLIFICLTGSMRTREEQNAYLQNQEEIRNRQKQQKLDDEKAWLDYQLRTGGQNVCPPHESLER